MGNIDVKQLLLLQAFVVFFACELSYQDANKKKQIRINMTIMGVVSLLYSGSTVAITEFGYFIIQD